MTHKGSCHCGQVVFEIEAELPAQVMACNCSICSRKGALMWFVGQDAFRLLTPKNNATSYRFNHHVIDHLFCSTCGIHAYGEGIGPGGKPMAMINVRCVEGVDVDALSVQHYDGRSR